MSAQTDLRAAIMAISADPNLTDQEKAVKRQQLMSGKWKSANAGNAGEGAGAQTLTPPKPASSVALDEMLSCRICLSLCERPVTAPCQHNFCLSCFGRWTAQCKTTCPSCRAPLPQRFRSNPRVNTALAAAIRLAKAGAAPAAARPGFRVPDASRPDTAFTTERAVRAGRANAASGRIRVTCPADHFGPITAEYDPERNQGVLVGEWWSDRLDCRQWGVHLPHVAGIAGQGGVGAQSVVLSGGYEDDVDEGEWFLYTGSGGRDLSGNKRTCKTQSFDQKFDHYNEALRVSCVKGLPVRVVRSHKEKRSAYAPSEETPVRYDGVYRILRAWRKPGTQKHLVCRYLFVRADSEPAPWSSGDAGDEPSLEIPAAAAEELAAAHGKVFAMTDQPHWDYNTETRKWGWAKPPPASQKGGGSGGGGGTARKLLTAHQRLLRDFKCGYCHKLLAQPVSTPCDHNFCKRCLDSAFEGVVSAVQPSSGGRALRVRRVPKPCPSCRADIADFLDVATVNRELSALIEKLQADAAEAAKQLQQEDDDRAAARDEGAAGASPFGTQDDADAAARECASGSAGSLQQPDSDGDADGAAAADAPAADADLPGTENGTREAGAERPEADRSLEAAAPAAGGEVPQAEEAPAVAAAAVQSAGATPRWASEAVALGLQFGEFEVSTIRSMLEDQGGDTEEVACFLKAMRRTMAAEARQQRTPKRAKRASDASEAAAGTAAVAAAPEATGASGSTPASGRGKRSRRS